MNHLVTIPKSDISKQDITDIAAGLILRIEEGEVNSIAAHVRLKAVVKDLGASPQRPPRTSFGTKQRNTARPSPPSVQKSKSRRGHSLPTTRKTSNGVTCRQV
jgi:hypothetical protein